MGVVKARPHKRVVKKSLKKIARYHSWRYDRVDASWRRPRGIDNPLRRHYRGRGAMPNIGYGSDKKTKFMDRDGFIRHLVHNVQDLEALMMHNNKYKAVIGHAVGGKTRKDIISRANELNIRVTNGRARLKTEEKE